MDQFVHLELALVVAAPHGIGHEADQARGEAPLQSPVLQEKAERQRYLQVPFASKLICILDSQIVEAAILYLQDSLPLAGSRRVLLFLSAQFFFKFIVQPYDVLGEPLEREVLSSGGKLANSDHVHLVDFVLDLLRGLLVGEVHLEKHEEQILLASPRVCGESIDFWTREELFDHLRETLLRIARVQQQRAKKLLPREGTVRSDLPSKQRIEAMC